MTQQSNDEVALETLVQDLGEEVKVGHERGLEDNRNVGGVEKLNLEVSLVTSYLATDNSQIDLETLFF